MLSQVFSNVMAELLLVCLWSISVPPTFVDGMHPLRNRLARFIKQPWRARPQGPAKQGLRVDQWFAIASVLGDLVISGIDSADPSNLFDLPSLRLLVCALSFGVSGGPEADFPASNPRFARIASVGPLEAAQHSLQLPRDPSR